MYVSSGLYSVYFCSRQYFHSHHFTRARKLISVSSVIYLRRVDALTCTRLAIPYRQYTHHVCRKDNSVIDEHGSVLRTDEIKRTKKLNAGIIHFYPTFVCGIFLSIQFANDRFFFPTLTMIYAIVANRVSFFLFLVSAQQQSLHSFNREFHKGFVYARFY